MHLYISTPSSSEFYWQSTSTFHSNKPHVALQPDNLLFTSLKTYFLLLEKHLLSLRSIQTLLSLIVPNSQLSNSILKCVYAIREMYRHSVLIIDRRIHFYRDFNLNNKIECLHISIFKNSINKLSWTITISQLNLIYISGECTNFHHFILILAIDFWTLNPFEYNITYNAIHI